MKERLDNLINDEAKEIMAEYRKAENELNGLKNQIMREKRDIQNLKAEFEELKKKQIKADKYDMPRKYIDAFVRDVTGYFAPGDKVFILKSKSRRIECDKCNGKKKVNAIIGNEESIIECPKCRGYGVVSESYYEIEESVIGNVYLKLCFNKKRVSLWTSDVVYLKGEDYAVDPKNIFRSLDDAEKALKSLVGGQSQ